MTMSLKQAHRIHMRALRRYRRHARSGFDNTWYDTACELEESVVIARVRARRIEDDLIARGKLKSTAMPF